MAAREHLSRQFTDKKGEVHDIIANRYGSVEAKSGQMRTGSLEVMLGFYNDEEVKNRKLRGNHLIYGISVKGNYKRRGIANAMFNLAEENYGPIEIGSTSKEGGEWKKQIEESK